MKLFRFFGRILFIALLITVTASFALFLYAPASHGGTVFSITKSIETAISILDTNTDNGFLNAYMTAMPAIMAIVYIFVAFHMLRRFIEMLRIIPEIFRFKDKSGKEFIASFDSALDITMSAVFGMILFLFFADTSIGIRMGEYTVPLIILSFAILLLSVFVKSKLLTASYRYALFNIVREGLSVYAAAMTLKYTMAISFGDMIVRFNQYSQMGEFSDTRLGAYAAYSYIFEPILFVLLSFFSLALLNRVITKSDNSLGQRNELISSCRRILFFAVTMAVIRIILTVYCSGIEIDTNLNKEFLLYIFDLVKFDLLPIVFTASAILVLHEGMLCIEYKSGGRAGKILSPSARSERD